MTLEQLWLEYCAAGLTAAAALPTSEPLDHYYLALLAFGQQHIEQAVAYAQAANREAPDNRVFAESVRYLTRVAQSGKAHVYVSPTGFTAFIRGGGNIPLYQATSAALQRIYHDHARSTLLDIGVGDGMALLPALTESILRVDLVEPAPALLDHTVRALTARNTPHRAFAQTLQTFITTTDEHWDLAQATFSLQSIPTAERPALLRWLQAHSTRLVLVEFDVPAFSHRYAPQRVRHIIERYIEGLAEYPDDDGTVAQGFLMPVMFGSFDPTIERTNEEQPIAAWVEQLNASGYTHVEQTLLFDYWWAPAYLLDARAPTA